MQTVVITDDLGLSKTDRDKLEKILLDFDEHWNPAALADAFANLILEPDEFCRIALFELIKVDLHRHWALGDKRKIDSYRSILESIGIGPEIPAQLILAEFLARHLTGKAPSSKEYRDRFPDQFEEFRKLFDAEKSRRTGLGKVQASISTDAGKAAIDTKTEVHFDPNALPDSFGRYKIQKRLGAGAMGAVYLAFDTQLDRQVALKTPTFGGVKNEDLIERFYREARAAANLRHPNICPVFDVGQIDGRHFITMAFIEGRPLSDYVGSSKLLEQKAIAGIIRKLALALADAHAAGVIHRDLKPANIMVDQKRQPLVMDFGLARREDEMQSRMTQSGTIMGTPAYMSPEQVKGKIDEIGPQADIYSLGIILYELLTGRLPFEGSVAAVIGQILTEEPTPPEKFRKDSDAVLQAICLRMIAKEQSVRYRAMKDVARDLADVLKGITPSVDIVPVDSVSVAPVVAALAEPAVWTDPLALPASQAEVQPFKPAVRTKPVFWKTPIGRYSMIGAALLGVFLIAWSITLVFRTPYGTLTITTDDPDLIVEVDGRQINILDDSPIQFADGSHELALRVGDILIPLGSSEPFEIIGRDGQYRLSANIGETELRSRQFTINRGQNTVLKISLTSAVRPELTVAPPLAPKANSSPGNSKTASPPKFTATTLQPSYQLSGHTGPIASLALASDGRLFASGAFDKTVCIWDSTLGRRVARITCPADVWRLNFAPGKTGKLAICCDNGSVIFWETDPRLDPWKAGKVARWNTGVVSQLETGQRNTIDVCFSPDGKLLATAGDDGTAKIWNTKTLGMITSIKAHPDRCTVVRFTPDGRKLLTGGKKGQAKVWNVSDGRKLTEYTGHDAARHMVFCADISPDGKMAVSAGNHELIHLWEIETGSSIRVLEGHVDEVISVEFSADGRSLVSGSFDGTFRIWDVETGQQIQQGTADHNGNNITIFGKDDSSIISAGGMDTDWKPVGQYSIRHWMRDGRIRSPNSADSTKDYNHLLTGQWVSWFDDLADQANGKKTFFANNTLECNDGIGWDMREDHPSRNAIIRVNIQNFKNEGQEHKPYLILRRVGKNSGYRAYLKGGDRIGIDKQTNGTWAVLREIDVGRKLDDYFEWTMAMIDDEITVYIDGRQLLSVIDPDSTAAGNTFFSTAGRARIKDMELMILDEAGEHESPDADDSENAWNDLFNGRNLDGWVDYQSGRPIANGWAVENSELQLTSGGGNIMTADQYGDFELEFEWKIAVGGNSGVFYRVLAGDKNPQQHGIEYQILDNSAHPNITAGQLGKISGAIYNFPAKGTIKRSFRGAEQWNSSRVVARGTNVEHWLNGEKVAEVVIGDQSWNEALRKTKAIEAADFGKLPNGHIVLQDHGSPVWFRNFRIRKLTE